MAQLDAKKRALLSRMGIDVWRLRDHERQSEDTIQRVESDQSENPQDKNQPEISQLITTSKDDVLNPSIQSNQRDRVGITLSGIAKRARRCQKCGLSETRTQAVPGEGSINAKWMFVGEAPGYHEDQQGRPFVGRAGQLLDGMIQALGMKREDVFIANVVKCRPPDNRDPSVEEVAQCAGYLHQQLSIIHPEVIVALGRVSAQLLLETDAPMSKLRQTVHYFGDDQIPLIATYHPAYLLRQPLEKSKSWEDLRLAGSVLKS